MNKFIKKHLPMKALTFYIFWLRNFQRGKLKKSIFMRREKDEPHCLDCGECCKNCPCLDSSTGKFVCKIWDNIEITRCKNFPVIPEQLELKGLKDKCRYYWEEE